MYKRRYVKRSRKTYKKRYPSRRRTMRRVKNTRNTLVVKNGPFPQRLFVPLRCSNNFELQSSATDAATLLLRPSSLYDIDPSAGGPSFAGYTKWSSVYHRNRVHSFKYKITFISREQYPMQVSVQPLVSDTTPLGNPTSSYVNEASENPYGKTGFLGNMDGMNKVVLKGYVNCTKLWGTPESANTSAWWATSGYSPQVNSWLRISALTMGSSLTYGVWVNVQITCYTQFAEVTPDLDS